MYFVCSERAGERESVWVRERAREREGGRTRARSRARGRTRKSESARGEKETEKEGEEGEEEEEEEITNQRTLYLCVRVWSLSPIDIFTPKFEIDFLGGGPGG